MAEVLVGARLVGEIADLLLRSDGLPEDDAVKAVDGIHAVHGDAPAAVWPVGVVAAPGVLAGAALDVAPRQRLVLHPRQVLRRTHYTGTSARHQSGQQHQLDQRITAINRRSSHAFDSRCIYTDINVILSFFFIKYYHYNFVIIRV